MTTIILVWLALSIGIILGAWWASRPKDTPTDWCLQHDSPMTSEICDHAKQILAEGRFAGVMCISAAVQSPRTHLRRIE